MNITQNISIDEVSELYYSASEEINQHDESDFHSLLNQDLSVDCSKNDQENGVWQVSFNRLLCASITSTPIIKSKKQNHMKHDESLTSKLSVTQIDSIDHVGELISAISLKDKPREISCSTPKKISLPRITKNATNAGPKVYYQTVQFQPKKSRFGIRL